MLPLSGLCPPNKGYSEFMSKAEEQYFDKYDQTVRQQAPLMEAEELPQAFNVKVVESALDTQVGGDHYSSMTIQPIEYITKNDIRYCDGNVIKYVSRHREKNGIEDLKKAKHYIDMIIEMEYGESK